MKYGITMFATDQTMAVHDLAREAEARGLHSLYIPEHTHIPTSRLTPAPIGDGELPEEYRRTVDPFVALSAAAALTTTIRLGTGICLVAQRDPFVTAKEIATLDQISGGRFEFGIGFGWNRDELEHHGIEFASRRDVVRERVLAMKELWARDEASFDGEHVSFSSSWSWPKPAQAGGPPVMLGGAPGPKMFAHIAEYCDGWLPIGGAGIRAALPDLHHACEAVGRDSSSMRVVPFGTLPDAGKLEYYESLGIDEVVLRVPGGGADSVLPVLDDFAEIVAAGW
ncbi:MAG: TIGR03619 family F420-dependent LLM class oxidoreductase [Actinobacteria bacterium]|nr:TIGR03619 family F420-dependent LLM class oxidoreductase [Actinomycetota bacterium]